MLFTYPYGVSRNLLRCPAMLERARNRRLLNNAPGLPAERAESLRDLPCSDVWAPIMTHALAARFVVDADARPVCGSGSGQEDPVPPGSVQLTRPPPRWHQDLGGCDATAGPAHDRTAAA